MVFFNVVLHILDAVMLSLYFIILVVNYVVKLFNSIIHVPNAVLLSVYSIIDIDILLFFSSMLFGCSALLFWHPCCVMLDVDFVILVRIQLFVFRILFFQIRELGYKADRCSLRRRQPYPIWQTRRLVVQMVLVIVPLETRAASLLRVVQNLPERREDGREEVPVQGTSSGEQNQRQSTLQNFRNLFSGYASSRKPPSLPPPAKRQKKSSSFLRKHGRTNFFA